MKNKIHNNFRYEIKYVLNAIKFNYFLDWKNSKSVLKKKYPNRIINSLYLDDLKFSSALDNLAGISNRSKKRFRWYENDKNNTNINFEEKVKIGKLGYKNIFKLKTENLFTRNINIKKILEIYYSELYNNNILFNNPLFPVLLSNYQRKYYEDFMGTRFTIDTNINFAEINNFTIIRNVRKILYDKVILEVKFNSENNKLVKGLLSHLNLMPVRNSKYLTGLAMFKKVTYL